MQVVRSCSLVFVFLVFSGVRTPTNTCEHQRNVLRWGNIWGSNQILRANRISGASKNLNDTSASDVHTPTIRMTRIGVAIRLIGSLKEMAFDLPKK